MKIGIKPRHLKATMLFAAKHDVRYYLNGVLFNGKTGELVATDGHRLIAIQTGRKSDDAVIIPTELIANVLKVIPKDLDDVELEYDADSKVITLHCLKDDAIDGRYPDYEVVMGNKKDALVQSPARFNADYLQDAAKAMKLIQGLGSKAVVVPNLLTRKPAKLDEMSYEEACGNMNNSATHFGDDYRITIMPVRG